MPDLRAPPIRLGVNVDHVATLRNARGGEFPDPVEAARMAADAGADGITAHLREDRRHIRDRDIARLKAEIGLPLNLEMAPTDEMTRIALATAPHAVCLVPERREERTTEGGLDVVVGADRIGPVVRRLADAGIRVSLFIEPDLRQVECAAALGAAVVEFHTGAFCERAASGPRETRDAIARPIANAAELAAERGLEVHAGHGLTYDTVPPIAAITEIVELNIGHFLIGAAISRGLGEAVRTMRRIMHEARTLPAVTLS